jgi:hypothetical protein
LNIPAISDALSKAEQHQRTVLVDISDASRVVIPVQLPFWTAYRASLILILYSRLHLWVAAIFPLSGAVLLALWILLQHHIRPFDTLALIAAFSYTPLSSLLSLYLARRRSPLLQGPFLYVFDDTGMHVLGQTFKLNIAWSSFMRVEESAGLMLFFTAKVRAQVLPMVDIEAAGALLPLRELVRQYVRVA